MKCHHCKREIPVSEINKFIAQRAGKAKSAKKAKSSAENGRKYGGRPRKRK